ncbi:hypothetical protein MTO96_016176 [Rhipicephalus appendiculatus]
MATVLRRKTTSRMRSTRAASGATHKVTRSSSQWLKSTTHESGSPSTSLPPNNTEETSPQRPSATPTVIEQSTSASDGTDNVTRRGHLLAELRTKLSDSIIASVDDNVIAVEAEDYSVAPLKTDFASALNDPTRSQSCIHETRRPPPHSSWYDTEGYVDEFQKWQLESSFESWPQDHLEYDYTISQGRELRSRSTQTELCAEVPASNEPVSRITVEALLEENVGEESWFDFRRLLGTPRNRSSFLASMAVLVAVCFTLGVIASLAGKAGTGEKGNNLELIPDAFENEQAAAHEEVDVTVCTTSIQKTGPTTAARRKATISRRRRPATVVFASRKPAIKARKMGRATRRWWRSRSTTRKRRARSSTSRRSKTTKQKKRRHTVAAKAGRRGAGTHARRELVTTKKGQRRSVTTDVPDDSITEQREENVVAAVTDDHDLTDELEPETSSVASRSRTSRRTPPRISTLDEDDEPV